MAWSAGLVRIKDCSQTKVRAKMTGRAHTILTACIAIPAATICGTLGVVPEDVAIVAGLAAILGDIFLSPDLDHDVGSLAYRMWGPLRWIWIPYQRALVHRSPLSHWPFFGTAGRVLYLGTGAYIILALAGCNLFDLLAPVQREAAAALVGLELANTVHFLADTFS